jgi:hypothetical protein
MAASTEQCAHLGAVGLGATLLERRQSRTAAEQHSAQLLQTSPYTRKRSILLAHMRRKHLRFSARCPFPCLRCLAHRCCFSRRCCSSCCLQLALFPLCTLCLGKLCARLVTLTRRLHL